MSDFHVSRQGRRRDGNFHSRLSVASMLPPRRLSGLSIVLVSGTFGGWMMGSIKSNR